MVHTSESADLSAWSVAVKAVETDGVLATINSIRRGNVENKTSTLKQLGTNWSETC
jgi:hypothetical protein